MVGKPKVPDSILYAIATYLANPSSETDIHVELHPEKIDEFKAIYQNLTGLRSGNLTYTTTDKYGIELRLHFFDLGNIPDELKSLYIHLSPGTWQKGNKIRVNHNNLIYQLFECGFVLGNVQNPDRISQFMLNRFPFL